MTKKQYLKHLSVLPVLPHMIAERAFWNALDKVKDYTSQGPEKDEALEKAIVPLLERRFEAHYRADNDFAVKLRKGCRNGDHGTDNDPRVFLEMYMTHWAEAFIPRYLRGETPVDRNEPEIAKQFAND